MSEENPKDEQPGKKFHQPETVFIGGFNEFVLEALPPDDPRLEPRERRGRPKQDWPEEGEEPQLDEPTNE